MVRPAARRDVVRHLQGAYGVGEGGQVRDSVLLNADETKGRKARRVFVSTRLQREITDYLKRTQPRAANPYLLQSQEDGCL